MENNTSGGLFNPDLVFKNVEKVDFNKVVNYREKRYVPTSTRKEIDEFIKNVDSKALSKADQETQFSFAIEEATRDMVNEHDIGYKKLEDVTNEVKDEENVNLTIRELTTSKRARTGKAALLKLVKATGVGAITQIPLYHSGFWITVRPLKDTEIINLGLDLSNAISELNKSTLGIVNTLVNLPYVEKITNLLNDIIINTTLKLDDEDDILDYININDLYTIAWGIAKSMYPKGMDIIVPCKNNAVVDENTGLPKCTYKARVKVDIDKLFWVDKTKFTKDHISQMSKRKPNSVTKDEVKEYQETLTTNEPLSFTLDSEDGSRIDITLQSCSVNRYLELGYNLVEQIEEYLDNVINKLNVKDEDAKENAKERILRTFYLKSYTHLFKEIRIDDARLESIEEIVEALEVFDSSIEFSKIIKDKLIEFLDRKLLTVIGIPNFTCPKCRATQSEDAIIPIAVYEYFFLLVNSRYNVIMEKQTIA